MRKRKRKLGSPPEVHREKAAHSFRDAAHHAGLAAKAIAAGRCSAAFSDILTAAGALEEAKAHADSNGKGESRWSGAAKRAVSGAQDRFLSKCVIKR